MEKQQAGVTRIGRFPKSEIISLLDVNRDLNLAESTSRDATLADLLRIVGDEDLDQLKLGYGGSQGLYALREEIGKSAGVPPGWLITSDDELRDRLIVAKMNIVISGSTLDEALAARLLAKRDQFLRPRAEFLARTLEILENWVEREQSRVEWVRPDAGALCCVRLRESAVDDSAVKKLWSILPELNLQIACGKWFGESDRVLRVGFGYLSEAKFSEALRAFSLALDRAVLNSQLHRPKGIVGRGDSNC